MRTERPGRMAIAFLINPISGGGVGKRVFGQLPEIMDSFGFKRSDWTADLTEAGRLEEQADRLLSSARKVIAVGGDGTIGFVLNRLRLRRTDEAEIGLIPLGTGNDLGRALGIYRIYNERGLIACIKRLLKAQGVRFDLWDINGNQTMASYVSLGMDAAVLHDFDLARKAGKIPTGALFNKLFYLRAFSLRSRYRIRGGRLLTLTSPQGERTINLDGSVCCLIGNINSYAAGARPFPRARFDDHALEVMVFDKLWKFALIVACSRVFPRFARAMKTKVKTYAATSITLSGCRGEYCQVDGEDVTEFLAENRQLIIQSARQVSLLDLRSEFFSLF